MGQKTTKYDFGVNNKQYGFELTYDTAHMEDFIDFMEDSMSYVERDNFQPQKYCDLVMKNNPTFVCKELV